MPEVGTPAPSFTLQTQTGETVSLEDFRGKKNVVLFFYPKANTPGCTMEACGFRDSYPEFGEIDAAVLGISPDPVKKQAKFAQNFDLPYPLLADEGHAIAEAYGVWKEKSFMGRKYMGVDRTTLLIDKNGVIRGVFQNFNIKSHSEQVLDALKEL